MFYIMQSGGKLDYNLKTYYARDEADLNNINTNICCPGSQAYTANGKLYTLNSNKEWIEVKNKEISSGEEIIITPGAIEQIKTGLFNKITVVGDNNLVPENIKEGTEIFGVIGNAKTTDIKITDAGYLFCFNARLDYMDDILKLFDNVMNMGEMFYGCESLTSLDLSNIDTSNVLSMREMFWGCSNLTSLDLSNFNTSNVFVMDNMFGGCESLTSLDLSNFNTSNVFDMNHMFSDCTKLTSLDLSSFDTSNVTDMYYMFFYCKSLTNLDLSNFNTSSVTNMSEMFHQCRNLTNLNVSSFDTSNVTDMSGMFSWCVSLTSLDLSNFNTSSVTNILGVLAGCNSLTNLHFGFNLGKGYTEKTTNCDSYELSLSSCPLLTHDSLISVINGLYDLNLTYNVANGGTLYTQRLILGSINLAKLTAEEIAIATNKGWTVS